LGRFLSSRPRLYAVAPPGLPATALALHESQEAFHDQQEVFHREQRVFHAEGLLRVRERYEVFKAGVSAAGEIFADLPKPAPPAPPPVESEPQDGRRPTVAKLPSFRAEGGTLIRHNALR